MSLDFDLLFTLRETQLQHGLRADDFAKYHHYLTGRIQTLRKQLKLTSQHPAPPSRRGGKRAASASSSKSQPAAAAAAQGGNKSNKNKNGAYDKSNPNSRATYIPPKPVTEALAAKDPKAITLLALQCERTWAESEELNHAASSAGSELLQRHNNSAALARRHSRARLARTEDHVARLVKIVDAVGSDTLKRQAAAYAHSMRGRNLFAHGSYEAARAEFISARALFHGLILDASIKIAEKSVAAAAAAATAASSSSPAQRGAGKKSSGEETSAAAAAAAQTIVVELRTECDDRIITCLRRLGLDSNSYRPPMETGAKKQAAAPGGGGGKEEVDSSASLSWLGRSLPVSSFFQVQNALRRFEAIGAFDSAAALMQAAAAVEDNNGVDGLAYWVFQQQSAFNKQQDSFDRAVGALNDALDAVATQIAAVSGAAGTVGAGAGATAAAAAAAASVLGGDIVNQLRLTQHCLRFRSLMCAVTRGYLAAWSFGARFLLGEELLVTAAGAAGSSASSSSSSSSLSGGSGKKKGGAGGGRLTRLPPKQLTGLPATGVFAPSEAKKELAFSVQHVVSPVDVVKLFDKVLSFLEEATLLPGVEEDSRTDVDLLTKRISADRLFFAAKGWEVVALSSGGSSNKQQQQAANDAAAQEEAQRKSDALDRCISSLTGCATLLDLKKLKISEAESNAASQTWAKRFGFVCPIFCIPHAQQLRRATSARACATAVASAPPQLAGATAPVELIASRSASASSNSSSSNKAASKKRGAVVAASDRLDEPVACVAFSQFPPDFQAAPCKPAFVDVAGTYANDYTLDLFAAPQHQQQKQAAPAKSQQHAHATSSAPSAAGGAGAKTQQQQQQQGGSWFSWLRGQ